MYPDALITIGKFSITLYDICFVVGIAACFVLFMFLADKKGIPKKDTNTFLDIALIAVITGIVTSILWQGIYNLIERGTFKNEYGAVGMTFIGGLIGGAGIYLIFLFFVIPKQKRVYIPTLKEIAPPVITIAHAFGRMGCFFAGCCYGKKTDSALGVDFKHVHNVYPTNLYESLFLFALTGVLIYFVLKDRKIAMETYLIAYGIFRFLIEFLRGDYRGSFLPGITPSQFWSILMIIGGCVLIYFTRFYKKKPLPDKNDQE